MLDVGCKVISLMGQIGQIGHRTPEAGHREDDVGCWMLDVQRTRRDRKDGKDDKVPKDYKDFKENKDCRDGKGHLLRTNTYTYQKKTDT